MGAIFICFFFWVSAVLLETTLVTIIPWFKPNLFFLFSCILCLRWRGFETNILAAFFGLTADCFSSIPFGIYGFSFFLISFFIRWYALKIFQSSYLVVAVITAVVTLLNNFIVYFLLNVFFAEGDITIRWLLDLVTYEIMPTAILTIPVFHLLLVMENRYRVRLAERKF